MLGFAVRFFGVVNEDDPRFFLPSFLGGKFLRCGYLFGGKFLFGLLPHRFFLCFDDWLEDSFE